MKKHTTLIILSVTSILIILPYLYFSTRESNIDRAFQSLQTQIKNSQELKKPLTQREAMQILREMVRKAMVNEEGLSSFDLMDMNQTYGFTISDYRNPDITTTNKRVKSVSILIAKAHTELSLEQYVEYKSTLFDSIEHVEIRKLTMPITIIPEQDDDQ